MGKSVRTVQRWEADLGLPVRRPNSGDRNVIVAMPEELNQWVLSRLKPRARQVGNQHCDAELVRMRNLLGVMITRAEQNRDRTSELIQQFKRARGRAVARETARKT